MSYLDTILVRYLNVQIGYLSILRKYKKKYKSKHNWKLKILLIYTCFCAPITRKSISLERFMIIPFISKINNKLNWSFRLKTIIPNHINQKYKFNDM